MSTSEKTAIGTPRPKFPNYGQVSTEPRLKDKVCVITGASKGFGQAIAVRFVEEGAKVAICARGDCDETISFISKIKGLNSPVNDLVLACKCDLASESDIINMVKAIEKKFGDKIHVLINNAALFVFRGVENATAAEWDLSNAVNIRGHALVTKYCLPGLKRAGGGSIVFQGSISSFLAQPNVATYSSVKAAMVQMARNCAYDFAPYNIRVNSVCAGTIETPISQSERKEHGWTYEQWETLKLKQVMLGRVGHPREIANATLFYASDESSYCTGSHLMVDGGVSANTTMEFDSFKSKL
jgi:dihydroanticapsin dehydrogenase